MAVEEEEEDDDVEEENRSQYRKAYFVRACAVEMRMDRVQEQFCQEIYSKNARPQSGNIVSMRASHFLRKFTGKCRTPIPGTCFCGACAVEMHMDI